MLPGFVLAVLVPTVLLFCGWMSFKAIESPEKDDDTQWLTFWLLFSLLNFAEVWTDVILSWIPFYYEIKIGVLIYLGVFRGAEAIYKVFVRPALKQHEKDVDAQIEYARKQAEKYAKQAEKLAKDKVNEGSKYVTSSFVKGLTQQQPQ